MTTYSVLPSGYDIDLLRNGGHFIMRDPAGLAAGVYFIEVSEARDDQGVRRTIQKFENAASGAVFARAVATTGWSSFIEVSATTAITLSGSQTGGLAKFASDTSLQQATAEEVRTAAGGIREPLSANRTYYVSTTGSDSNDGLTAGTPLLTLQAAYNKVAALDLNSKSVTISVAAGTYSAGISATAPVVGLGFISITGAGATTVISSGAAAAFSASGGAAFTISNLKLSAATGNCIYAINNGYVGILGGITFGASTQSHMRSDRGGTINLAYLAAITIEGGASAHIFANGGDVIAYAPAYTLTGTPNFSTFANANGFGYVAYWTGSFTGAATGVRYSSSANSVINVFGAGVNYFPGSAAGNTSLGGQYV